MHVFQAYIETILNYIKVKPIQIHNRKFHKFPFVYFIKNKTNSASCLNKSMQVKLYAFFKIYLN